MFKGGTEVVARISLNVGKSEDGNPKVWVNLDAVQWVAQHASQDAAGGLGDEGFAPTAKDQDFGDADASSGGGSSADEDLGLDDDLGLDEDTPTNAKIDAPVEDDDLFG